MCTKPVVVFLVSSMQQKKAQAEKSVYILRDHIAITMSCVYK